MSFNLLNLMEPSVYTNSGQFFALFGALFLIGCLALLALRKAVWLQLGAMAIMTLPFTYAVTKYIIDGKMTANLFQAVLGSIGSGAVLAWAVVIAGLLMYGPFRSRAWLVRRAFIGKGVKWLCSLDPSVPVARARSYRPTSPPIRTTEPGEHAKALASGERFLEIGDLDAALRAFGRGLGTSANDNERAVSKVKIATVLGLKGKHGEASLFLQEARELDPWVEVPSDAERMGMGDGVRRPVLGSLAD